jgi:hypothetical protein
MARERDTSYRHRNEEAQAVSQSGTDGKIQNGFWFDIYSK